MQIFKSNQTNKLIYCEEVWWKCSGLRTKRSYVQNPAKARNIDFLILVDYFWTSEIYLKECVVFVYTWQYLTTAMSLSFECSVYHNTMFDSPCYHTVFYRIFSIGCKVIYNVISIEPQVSKIKKTHSLVFFNNNISKKFHFELNYVCHFNWKFLLK